MHKDAGIKRFGPIFEEVPLTQVPDGLKKEHVPEGVNANLFKQAEVYEIWDKTTRNVYWVAKDFDQFLDTKSDPLGLKNFFRAQGHCSLRSQQILLCLFLITFSTKTKRKNSIASPNELTR